MNHPTTATLTPPGPTPWELLKKLPAIRSNATGYLMEAAQQWGDVVFFDVPRNPALFINSPDTIKHILQDQHRLYNKNTMQYNLLSGITGKGLLTADGEDWLRHRRLQQPAFARPRLMSMDQIATPAMERMLNRWEQAADSGEPLNIDNEMMRLALEIVGKALLSIDLSDQASRLVEAVVTVLDGIVHKAQNPGPLSGLMLTPGSMRFRSALSTLELTIYDMIAARRESGDPGDDLLGMLLRARDEQGNPMSDKQIRDEVMTILVAGHETVASALTWTWMLLAQNPGEAQKLEDESGAVLNGRIPTTADLAAMPHAARVFSEALRLYPPAWLITRKSTAEDQIGPYRVPAGALIIMSPYTLQRRADLWPEPEKFMPDRFAAFADGQPPRFTYIPFGAGPRLCIGREFAMIEAQLVLGAVAGRFRLSLLPDRPVHMEPLVTLRPRGGLWMKVEKR